MISGKMGDGNSGDLTKVTDITLLSGFIFIFAASSWSLFNYTLD